MVLFLYGTIKYIIMVIINRYLLWLCLHVEIFILSLKKNCVYIHIDGLNM